MKQTVFVLTYEENDSNDVRVLSTREKAMDAFRELCNECHESAEEYGWTEEYSETWYEAYEEGYYNQGHLAVYVQELEVE